MEASLYKPLSHTALQADNLSSLSQLAHVFYLPFICFIMRQNKVKDDRKRTAERDDDDQRSRAESNTTMRHKGNCYFCLAKKVEIDLKKFVVYFIFFKYSKLYCMYLSCAPNRKNQELGSKTEEIRNLLKERSQLQRL